MEADYPEPPSVAARILKTLAALIVLFVTMLLLFMGLSREMDRYSSLINGTGRIRGGIQRAVKLELAGKGDDGALAFVDGLIAQAQAYRGGALGGLGHRRDYIEHVEALELEWKALKATITAYRRGGLSAEALLGPSERLWSLSNKTVDYVEGSAHRGLALSTILSLIVGLGILGLLGLFVATKVLVRDRMEVQAEHDELTGLYNRHYFNRVADRASREAGRREGGFALLMCDIDHFKRINDNFGHETGDKALKAVAQALKDGSRKTDIVARFGGEEFVILSTGEGEDGYMAYAEKLRMTVEGLKMPADFSLTISVGLALHKRGNGFKDVLGRADEALYAAKAAGRNRLARSE